MWLKLMILGTKYWKHVAIIVLAAGLYVAGYTRASNHYRAEMANALEEVIAERDEAILESRKRSAKIHELEDEIDAKNREGVREVIRYVKSKPNLADCELDDDGLQLWNN